MFMGISVSNLTAWEDHPDIPDHSETDRIFIAAQKQTGAEEYECLALIEKEQKLIADFLKGIFPDELTDFKDGKFIRDIHDKN